MDVSITVYFEKLHSKEWYIGITNPKTPAFGLQIRKSEEEREEGLQIPSLLLSDCKSEKAKFKIQKKQEESRKGSQNKAVEKGAILLLLFLF